MLLAPISEEILISRVLLSHVIGETTAFHINVVYLFVNVFQMLVMSPKATQPIMLAEQTIVNDLFVSVFHVVVLLPSDFRAIVVVMRNFS